MKDVAKKAKEVANPEKKWDEYIDLLVKYCEDLGKVAGKADATYQDAKDAYAKVKSACADCHNDFRVDENSEWCFSIKPFRACRESRTRRSPLDRADAGRGSPSSGSGILGNMPWCWAPPAGSRTTFHGPARPTASRSSAARAGAARSFSGRESFASP